MTNATRNHSLPETIKLENGLTANFWYADDYNAFYRVFVSGWYDPIICVPLDRFLAAPTD